MPCLLTLIYILFTDFYATRHEDCLRFAHHPDIWIMSGFWLRLCSNVGETTSSRHGKIAGIQWWTTVGWISLSSSLPLHASCTQLHWGPGSKWTRHTSCKGWSGKPSSRKRRSPNNSWPCRGWSRFLMGSTFLYNLQWNSKCK